MERELAQTFAQKLYAQVDALQINYIQLPTKLTRTLGPAGSTCGLRAPAACVLYVPEVQGGSPPGRHALYAQGTRARLGRAARTLARQAAAGCHPRLPMTFQDAILESIATKQNITQSRRYKDNMQAQPQEALQPCSRPGSTRHGSPSTRPGRSTKAW